MIDIRSEVAQHEAAGGVRARHPAKGGVGGAKRLESRERRGTPRDPVEDRAIDLTGRQRISGGEDELVRLAHDVPTQVRETGQQRHPVGRVGPEPAARLDLEGIAAPADALTSIAG